MTPEHRQLIRDTAKYLRHVRPIDPREFTTYLTDDFAAEEVRAVIRDLAPALDLVEQDDGRFVPVSSEPLQRALIEPIQSLPPTYGESLADLLTAEYGPAWHTGVTGETLREAIREFKESYFRGRPVTYTTDTAFGYAVYHFPAYYATIQYVLTDLLDRDLLDQRIRVLDVGAGTGAPALGLHDVYFPRHVHIDTDQNSLPLVEYHALEPSAAAAILDAILTRTDRNFHSRVIDATAESFTPTETYDLILFANVLSELDDPVATIRRYETALSERGSLVLIAPADRETSTELRTIERDLVNGLSVYSPTIRLWPDRQPTDTCWSFDAYPDLAVPDFQRHLDDPAGSTGEFVNVDVKFSYAILRTDAERRIQYTPTENRYAKLADTERHVTDRINCVAIKLSRDLGDDRPVFLIGDGSQHTDHYAVHTAPSRSNRALLTAAYGDLLAFENVLVLWNEDEAAYNLVVDDATIVDHHSPKALTHRS